MASNVSHASSLQRNRRDPEAPRTKNNPYRMRSSMDIIVLTIYITTPFTATFLCIYHLYKHSHEQREAQLSTYNLRPIYAYTCLLRRHDKYQHL